MSPTPQPPDNNRTLLLVWIISFIGAPVAAGFAWNATNDLQLGIAVMILYLAVDITVGFVAKVWGNLSDKWADRTADKIDNRAVRAIGSRGYKKRYLQHLTYRYRDFDVKGLSTQGTYTLDLEKVFVELSVAPQAMHDIPTDPLHKIPDELSKGSHTIWQFLQADTLTDSHLAVIGAPGCGKTTLLKHMTLILASQQRDKPIDKLPILLFLRDLTDAIKTNPDLFLEQAVQSTLAKWKADAPEGWFEDQLKKGDCLILLDGLDEVADLDTRKTVVNWVEKQMTIYANNSFIVTSRPFGYISNPLSGVTVLEVRPFTVAQVKRFVQSWYLANEMMSSQKDDPGVQMKAKEGAEDLLKRIHGSGPLSDLAVNPLLLTMIATVHRYRSALPGRRVELYAEICEVFLGKRQEARGLKLDLTPAQKQRILQPLAYAMMVQEIREIGANDAESIIRDPLASVSPDIAAKDFLKGIENQSGLLIERENSVYSFSHLTFQEYLASVHVKEQNLVADMVTHVHESWWHETILLYSAKADATPIIAACLADDKPTIPALKLALLCQEEALEIDQNTRAKLERILDEGIEEKDEKRRRLIANVLLEMRL